MKLVNLKNKDGVIFNSIELEDPTAWISEKLAEQTSEGIQGVSAEVIEIDSKEVEQAKKDILKATLKELKNANSVAKLKDAVIAMAKLQGLDVD